MASYTVQKLISLALLDAGIIGQGQTASSEDANNALTRLNWMVSQWARKRWLIWVLETLAFTSTGAESYTVGPAGNYPIDPRPDRLEDAFLRQLNTPPNAIDYPLELIEARETYNRIALKSLQSFPTWVFYDSAYPTARIYPWPVPQASIYAVHITFKHVLSEFTGLSQTIALPPEYLQALHTNLSVIIRDAYNLPPMPVMIARAKASLSLIRNSNAQIPRLQMPDGLVKPGIYNVYSDQVR